MLIRPVFIFFLLCLSTRGIAGSFQITVPSFPPSNHVVQSNFLGISFELSFLDQYLGTNTSAIPLSLLNYLSALRARTGDLPLRLRIGGNSVDTSVYAATSTSPTFELVNSPVRNVNNQPVLYGPVVWDILNQISSNIGGATYLIGLPFLDPIHSNVSVLAAGAFEKLGNNLDGLMVGNEPDLYSQLGERPDLQNYTSGDYMDEFQTVLNQLKNTSAGNILDKRDIGGPSICCTWNLETLLDEGYSSRFGSVLKYISLQHYPQNNCAYGAQKYKLPYYTQHANVVNLSTWQGTGINTILSNKGQQVIMSEFNTASCGGIPHISDTYAAGTLWTANYALQLASVGYSAAYIHTRERGISYNVFTPPNGPNGGPGPWTTNPPYYALLAVSEALRSKNGSIVADLNIGGSAHNNSVTVSGYAIYDANNSTVQQLVLFNWANVSSSESLFTSFDIPSGVFKSPSAKSMVVKYLVGDTLQERDHIGWGGQSLANVTDGKLVTTNTTWSIPNIEMDCSKGCTIDVPAPGMAILFGSGVVNGTNAVTSGPVKSSQIRIVPSSSMPGVVIFTMTTVLGSILL